MRTSRRSVSFVSAGKSVRVDISFDHMGLTREETAEAVTGIADGVMSVLNEAKFVRAPLSKIKVR